MILNPSLHHVIDFIHLRQTDPRIEIGRTDVESGVVEGKGAIEFNDVVFASLLFRFLRWEVFCPPMAADVQKYVVKFFIICTDHPTFYCAEMVAEKNE